MGMSAGNKGGANAEINVTPLVDVCLVLLIIFMVMVPRKVPELSIRIPPESKQKRPKPSEEAPLVIGLREAGGVTLNRNPIQESSLADEISRQLEFREKKVVFVNFDAKAKYGRAVELMDLAKRAGAEVVGIMRDKDYKMPETLKGL